MHIDRFSGRERSYAANRPSYPIEAIDVVLDGLGDPSSLSVVDVGAGTGISSRLIASRGPRVLAIEPNAAMRSAAAPHALVEWIDGTAEHTTLPDASADVVAAFQAWHWVDHEAASTEADRILRPGGRFAVVYNERDERDDFTAGYGDIVRRYALDDTERKRADAVTRCSAIDARRARRFEFFHPRELDRASLHGLADSSSYLPHDGDPARAMHADIDALIDAREDDGTVTMHMVTIVVCVDR